ncbi:hypothetical protein diail_3273 [Diaporthe ilicicola]|nr:hypothetical protein diail_3273 [Diaporthe ilicicola]
MEAVGLASSIITFIDVAIKIVRGAHEVYTSADGATRGNDHTGVVIRDLQRVTADLRSHPQSSNDQELVILSNKCHKLSDELLQLLHDFLPKTPGKWQSFVAACRTLRKQKEVAAIEASLDRYRQQISQRLLWLLFEQQSPIKKSLDEMLHHANTLHNLNARKMEDVECQLSQSLKYLKQFYMDKTKTEHHSEQVQQLLAQTNDKIDHLGISATDQAVSTSAFSLTLEDLVRQIQSLSSIVQAMPSQNLILRRLFYRSIFRREDEVMNAAGETFRWIFSTSTGIVAQLTMPQAVVITCNEPLEESEENLRMKTSRKFIEFLRHSGCTLFVEGKAGCGKSTFMKYIAHHKLADSNLKIWAGAKKLVIIKVFFWQSDDPLQESIEGFLRSILFQVLSQCPELIGDIFPHRPEDEIDAVEYRPSELEEAFARLLNLETIATHCFFCFIDGLDEHQGDNLSHENLANQLVSWASHDNVKIMCSARPYTVFLETFREAGDIIEFHKLTRSDISNFVEVKFTESLAKPKLLEAQRNCLGLLQDITTNAQGIFLWASMVVRTLINQALDQDGKWQNPTAERGKFRTELPTLEFVPQDTGYPATGLDATTTVWMVFLRDFANNVKLYCWKRHLAASWPLYLNRDWLERLSKIIEAYLNAGADPSIYFLIFHKDPKFAYKASLYQLLDVFKPKNLASFDKLLRKPWWKDILAGSGLLSKPPAYQSVTTDLLLSGEWKTFGVGSDNGQELMGSFKARVF